jgi:hypothetical protein
MEWKCPDRCAGNGVILTVSDGLGHTGSSNPFDLVDGQISRFAWIRSFRRKLSIHRSMWR